MSLFVPLKRTTVHIPDTGPAHDAERGHLYIVLNDPGESKKSLLVCVCSWYDKCDQTCVLTGGHKFITRRSFVFYAKADAVESDLLMRAVNEGNATYEGLFAEGEFALVHAGVPKSPHTRPIVKDFFNKYCGA